MKVSKLKCMISLPWLFIWMTYAFSNWVSVHIDNSLKQIPTIISASYFLKINI